MTLFYLDCIPYYCSLTNMELSLKYISQLSYFGGVFYILGAVILMENVVTLILVVCAAC